MAYLLSNICTKNYWNRTTIVEIIVGGWVVSFFETQCIFSVSILLLASDISPLTLEHGALPLDLTGGALAMYTTAPPPLKYHFHH